jgi:hypothetical protein
MLLVDDLTARENWTFIPSFWVRKGAVGLLLLISEPYHGREIRFSVSP